MQIFLRREALISLLNRGQQNHTCEYTILSPCLYETEKHGQNDCSHRPRTGPGGQNSFAILLVFHPTLSKMAANNQLTTKVVSDFQELYQNIDDIENTEFTFDNEGRLLLKKKKMDYFVAEVNKAVREGKVQVKDARLLSCNE